jgi:hypothetical protein
MDRVSAAHLHELEAERHAERSRALRYVAVMPAAAVAYPLGLAGWRAIATAAVAMVAVAIAALLRSRSVENCRLELLDEFIVRGWRNVAPADVAQREAELVSPRYRRMLARALLNQLDYATKGVVLTLQMRFVTAELKRLERQVDAIAARLRDLNRPIDPRAVVVVSRLLSDGSSPLHGGPSDAIEPALVRARRMLDD